MVRQGLIEIIAKIPTNAEAISPLEHELAFRSDALKEHHYLQLKEDNWVNRRPPQTGIGLLNKLPHKREIQLLLKRAIKMVLWNELFKRDRRQRSKTPFFHSHHRGGPPSCLVLLSSFLPSIWDFFNRLRWFLESQNASLRHGPNALALLLHRSAFEGDGEHCMLMEGPSSVLHLWHE
jgi:hypothetical protein